MSTLNQSPDPVSSHPLSIAVISPDSFHREEAINALARFTNGHIREFISYPPGAGTVSQALKQDFDVIIVDLDTDTDYALELIEGICDDGSTHVIVISEQLNPDLLLRCMRVGAREFLPVPISEEAMTEALLRVSTRRVDPQPQSSAKRGLVQSAPGRVLLFMSAKGGSGVTTLACSLAVSLAEDFNQRTLLIDLTLPLGDAALDLGIHGEYSTVNALQNFHRLDGSLLSSIVVRHESGLFVLPAPADMTTARFQSDAVFKLLRVARQEFDYVVVDAGSRFGPEDAFMMDDTATVFLVTQIGIPELRNSSRLIKQLVVDGGPKVEIVLNRFNSASAEIDEGQIKKALTQPVHWKIPNDYTAVRRMQDMGTPINREDSEIARAVREMGQAICGLTPEPKRKKKLLGIF